MTFWSRCISILAYAALFWCVPVWAQSTGTITGTVVNTATGEQVEFAQVYIKALSLGVVSDEQGRFTLSDVPAGTHELRADLNRLCGCDGGCYGDSGADDDCGVADGTLRAVPR